jgi:hypothetical protein
MRVNPESYIVEGADTVAQGRRQYLPLNCLCGRTFREQGLRSRLQGEPWNRRGPMTTTKGVAIVLQGKTGAALRERSLGVGLSHSSEEPCEGWIDAIPSGGAKGRAEQGTLRGER